MSVHLKPAITADQPGLKGAFEMFVQASQALELQYAFLQEKVEQLNTDLVIANERLRFVLNALPSAVLVIEDQLISHFNVAAKELFPDLVPGQPWRIPETWQRGSGPDEFLFNSPKRRMRTLHVKRADTAQRSIIQIQDITANLQKLEESERIDRLAAMGQMTAGIAHQIHTPLATALLYAAHLTNQGLPPSKRKEFAKKLQNRLIHLKKVASEMLQFVRVKPPNVTPVSLAELISESYQIIDGLLQSKQQLIIKDLDAPDAKVLIDRQSVVSAFVAILENAIQSSPIGATIVVKSCVDGANVKISLTDQGPGIAAEMLECLFEPFATNRNTGTGLGLAIALTAVRAHRGDINANNLPEGGAQFTISLPQFTTP